MAESERRVSAIHQSLTQPILLAGAERPLAIANWITAAALILGGGLHWYTIAMGAFLLTVGHWALVQAAKFDPAAQPGLRPARPLPGLLSGSRLSLLRHHRESIHLCRRPRRFAHDGEGVGICFSESSRI